MALIRMGMLAITSPCSPTWASTYHLTLEDWLVFEGDPPVCPEGDAHRLCLLTGVEGGVGGGDVEHLGMVRSTHGEIEEEAVCVCVCGRGRKVPYSSQSYPTTS